MSLKRSYTDRFQDDEPSARLWISPSPIIDRKSTFTAYFSTSMPPRALQKHLKSLDQTKTASHHILAWRVPCSEKGTLEDHFQKDKPRDDRIGAANQVRRPQPLDSGSDDDGERYGGRHVLRALEAEDVQGSLVVARWYGGVLLGPMRFTHIENIGKAAITEWRREAKRVKPSGEEGEAQDKEKTRLVEDREKARLVRELGERDSNIEVLRKLLREKTAEVQAAESKEKGKVVNSSPPGPSTSPSKKPDYSSMTLDALRRIDKARDSTVAFLLKRIDEAEKAVHH